MDLRIGHRLETGRRSESYIYIPTLPESKMEKGKKQIPEEGFLEKKKKKKKKKE
jgi:hypothetical protein